MRCRATLNLGTGMLVVCAPEETGRLARDLARSGECAFPLRSEFADERGVEWTEDSGP